MLGKTLVIIGGILLIVAIALGAIGFTRITSPLAGFMSKYQESAKQTITIPPSKSIEISNISSTQITLIIYNTTIGALKVMYEFNGANNTATQASSNRMFVAMIQPGSSAVFLVNNYTTPISVSYVAFPVTSTLITGGVMIFAAIILGIVGIIVLIVGGVFWARGK